MEQKLNARKLLQTGSNTSVSTLPSIQVFVGQNSILNTSSAPTWVPFTPYTTCTFEQSKSFSCLVLYKDITRPNPSLPAVLVAVLQPTVVAAGDLPLQSVSVEAIPSYDHCQFKCGNFINLIHPKWHDLSSLHLGHNGFDPT